MGKKEEGNREVRKTGRVRERPETTRRIQFTLKERRSQEEEVAK